ncbi:hypothetical protein ACSV4D_12735 [Flavobacterium sp. ARAG 55.4]|uniref:hypothetical protein n=1 Tax=Flavobacterium sp. ARAG 55.4 TaxID=3451357 RepID=UPI003F473CC5
MITKCYTIRIKKNIHKIRLYTIKKLFRNYKNKYLIVTLKGGLCNKLHCLFSACDIALKKKAYIVEPYFGWNSKILFSDIYDIEYFNEVMSKHYSNKNIMIPKDKIKINKFLKFLNLKLIDNDIDLWNYSEKELEIERKSGMLSSESTKLKVLEALKLKPKYENIVKEYLLNGIETAIQIRTESDWKKHAEFLEISDQKESVLVSLDKIISMLSTVSKSKNIFFTSGENHQEIINYFKKKNYSCNYFFDSKLEYEINAAINFEICSRASFFIGNSRSSYSNLISLKRALRLSTDKSFIYNYGNEIHLRIDKGLQTTALESISKKTIVY